MRYLIDTNIVSDVMRNPRGPVSKHFARVRQHNICTSIIVAAELRYGALHKGATKLVQTIEGFLNRVATVPFDYPADLYYAEIRNDLERAGKPIGRNDTLIAAHALALGCILVTDNEREFSRVRNLVIENWLR